MPSFVIKLVLFASFAFVIASDDTAEHQHVRTHMDDEGKGRLLAETKHVVNFGCVANYDHDFDRCFNTDEWCWNNLYGYGFVNTTTYAAQGGAYASATYGIMAYTLCEIAKQAMSWVKAFYLAKGTFQVTRHGKNGAVFDIDLKTQVNTATLVAAVAATRAEANANATYSAYVYTNVTAFCKFLKATQGPVYDYICLESNYNQGQAYGNAEAQAYSSAFSLAAAGGESVQRTSVYVKGSNLQTFQAIIAAGASNFANAGSKSLATALAASYTQAFTDSYVQICQGQINLACTFACRFDPDCYQWCISSDCSESYAAARLYVEAVAKAFGQARAESFAKASVNFVAKAYFSRTKGKTPNKENGGDIIKVSELGSGFAEAGAFTSCG